MVFGVLLLILNLSSQVFSGGDRIYCWRRCS